MHAMHRTVKAAVKHELTIPKQTRYLVPIKLGRVERHVRGSVCIRQTTLNVLLGI